MKRRDPLFKLVAFGLLLPVLLLAPVFSWVWLAGVVLVVMALMAASLPLAWVGRGLFRLRWLFLAMLLTHGWFTPGEPLWSEWPALTREGVVAGGVQSLRLVLLALLAWSLMKTTTPMELVGVFSQFLGWLERFGVPVQRGLSILAFCLASLPILMAEAIRVREGMTLRLDKGEAGKIRLERLAFAGGALLLRMVWSVRRREEGLRTRGFLAALPSVERPAQSRDWRDWGVILLPALVWLFWVTPS
ncbi:MAG: hypothetical protein HQL94_02050 [Magnetococcales bacterium]|nr:hypothetical protein [Magnetococcales bacterium]MBF0440141.1 hypothetical protein [Magnetococcales bacterium]